MRWEAYELAMEERRPLRFVRSPSVRAFVGSFLYFEGIAVVVIGLTMMVGYWPPFVRGEETGNPVSFVGMCIAILGTSYLVIVGGVLFVYHLIRPPRAGKFEPDPRWERFREYEQLRREGEVIFDDAVVCCDSAREAYYIRRMLRD